MSDSPYTQEDYGCLASLDEICRALDILMRNNPNQAIVYAPLLKDFVLRVDQNFIAERDGPFFRYLAEAEINLKESRHVSVKQVLSTADESG